MKESVFFKRKRVIMEALIPYGFVRLAEDFCFSTELLGGQFYMTVTISKEGCIHTKVIDQDSTEEYVLHRVPGAVGSFAGSVREAYENILADIAVNCFEKDIFKSEQAQELIVHVRKTYGDELEYLWQKFPDNAVWRRKETGKWYGALLTVSKRKLGIPSDEIVEIIDLRETPGELTALIDNNQYFPGWHMNKKNWYTMILDGSVSMGEICSRIHKSYLLAVK